jgi:hypothetical protein
VNKAPAHPTITKRQSTVNPEHIKKSNSARYSWLIPAILATWEADGKMVV